jgi:hypothetical protein
MESFRRTRIVQFVLFLQIFLIFNYSIDIPDQKSDAFAEDLSVNDIESITELVLEQVFDLQNFVSEHEDDDPDDKSTFAKKIDIIDIKKMLTTSIFKINVKHFFSCDQNKLVNSWVKKLTDPPEA